MKTQMRFQKILMLVSLVIAALTFVFAMAFLTGSMGEVSYYLSVTGGVVTDSINCQNFMDVSQNFVSTLEILSIIFILIAVALFITASNTRRNYYITNYISVGLFVAFALVIGIYIVAMVAQVQNIYLNEIDWTAANGSAQIEDHVLSQNCVGFALGYVMFVLVILDAVAVVLSTVWKIKLMQGEKALLAGSAAKEVA